MLFFTITISFLRLKDKLEPSAGFGPATITLPSLGLSPKNPLPIMNRHDLDGFEQWLKAKYSVSYAKTMLCYAKKNSQLLSADSHLGDLELLSNDVKSSTIKSLILLSKFLGIYPQFKLRLNEHGIKLYRPDSLNAFLRILNSNNSDILNWFRTIFPSLNSDEQVFQRFLLFSGLRTSEAINSFNKIIELSKENKISDYYDEEMMCLCHFKYPKQFIRRTKNCFITFITSEELKEISNCRKITYNSMRKRLERQGITKMRFSELRDYFGTYLLNHGLLEQEVNLLQGRIPVSVFVRHYWSPKLKELAEKTLRLLKEIQDSDKSLSAKTVTLRAVINPIEG
jgi:hypothetical protein